MTGGPPPSPPPEPDPGAIARLNSVFMDGIHHNAPDRELAEAIRERFPATGKYLMDARAFHSRLLHWAVTEGGARGLLIAASGYPLTPEMPEAQAALEAQPDARAAYADADPEVAAVNRAVLSGERVSAYQAWSRDPAVLLSAPEAAALPRPLCVLLRLVMHYHPPDVAAGLVAEYARLLPPDSLLAMSVIVPSETAVAALSGLLREAGAGLEVYRHPPGEVASWLTNAGLEVVPPGVVDIRLWPGQGWAEDTIAAGPRGRIVGAVARVP